MSFQLKGKSTPKEIDITVGDDNVAVRILCRKNKGDKSEILVYKSFGFNGIFSKFPIAKFQNHSKKIIRLIEGDDD